MKRIIKSINYKSYLYILLKSVFAGIMIGIGGTIYLSLDNKIVGSFLFAFGLLNICIYEMNLYTGKIGYLIIEKFKYLLDLLIILIGNFIGTYLTALVLSFTKYGPNLVDKAQFISNLKLNDSLVSIFVLSLFCGMLMYIAVNNYKKSKDSIGKYICIFLSVSIFILSGFEHCVANMYYFSLANIWSINALLYLIVMVLGNSIGSIIISFYDNYLKK